MRLLQSLSFRLAMTYAGLFCVSVAALLGLYYWISVKGPLDAAEKQIRSEAQELARIYILDGDLRLTQSLGSRSTAPARRKAFHAFIDKNGRVVSSNLPSWPKSVTPGWLRFEADIYRDGDESDHEALVLDRKFNDSARLLIGRDIEDIDDAEEQIASAALWILGGTLILGLFGGMLMSNAIHKRIDAVNSAARKVISGDLSGRIAIRGTGDDFDRLGQTLNLMLARIEALLESVRRVSDNVAHELRTPLARLLANLEELDDAADDPARQRGLCTEAIREAQRLHRIFDALLRIARIESGRHMIEMRPFDLSGLAEDAIDTYQPDAESKCILLQADISPATTIMGDPDMIYQALSNLIENALKYSPAGSKVLVRVVGDQSRTILSVADNGPGVLPEESTYLGERFYRSAVTRHFPGEGLGLSLVAAIAVSHEGKLSFRDNEPGLIVDLTFAQ